MRKEAKVVCTGASKEWCGENQCPHKSSHDVKEYRWRGFGRKCTARGTCYAGNDGQDHAIRCVKEQ